MSLQVLLVDDDDNIAECIECILDCSGLDLSFKHVASGSECLDELRKGFQGFIMMDVMMPGMTGWETIEKMVSENLCENSLISMFTSVSDPPAHTDQLASYVMNYIRKPTSTTRIIEAVTEAMMMCSPSCC